MKNWQRGGSALSRKLPLQGHQLELFINGGQSDLLTCSNTEVLVSDDERELKSAFALDTVGTLTSRKVGYVPIGSN